MSGAGDGSPSARPRAARIRALSGLGVFVVGMLTAGLMLSVLAQQIIDQDRNGRQGLQDRVTAHTKLINDFVVAYVDDLILQIQAHAQEALAGPDPSIEDFGRSSNELRLGTLLLLDADGLVMQVLPSNPALIGTDMGERYDHLSLALDGGPAVSNVVPSAGDGTPIVAFAVPFQTFYGRRVLSGGLDLDYMPLDELMRTPSAIRTQVVFLIDANDQIVAGSSPDMSGPLAGYDPAAEAVMPEEGFRSTVLHDGDEDRFFVTDEVEQAPWRIVTTVTTAELYRPLGDRSSPWRLFTAFTLVSLLSLALVTRVLGHRRELRASVEKLDDLTSTLRDSEEELRLTQENAATGMALVSLDGYFLQVNRALCAIVRRSPEELANLTALDITHPDDFGSDRGQLARLLDGEIPSYDIEKRYLRPDGSSVWVEVQVSLLRDQLDQPKRYIIQVLDIEQRKLHQDQLTREVSVRRLAEEAARVERDFSSVLLAAMHEGYLFTTDGVIVDVNDQVCALTEFSRADLVGRSRPWPFWPAESADEYLSASDAMRTAGGGDIEVNFRRKSGGLFPVALAVRTARNADGTTHGYITIVSDLTEVKRREEALIAAAGRDALTGLFNRRAIDDQLTDLRPLDAVILLDLDFFKQVNDTQGHAAGDEVLISLANCISETLRGKDWAGRLGGEEFVIVARDGGVDGARSVVDRLRRRWSDTTPLATFSAGIAVHTFGASPLHTLGHADGAMYLAKRNGRNRTETFALPDPATRR